MKIPVSRPDLSDLEKNFLNEAFDSTWISSAGKFLDLAENHVAELSGKKYCVLTSNGTVAIHLGLEAIGIRAGDEVIVPSLTFIASVNAITYTGAVPVFVDVEPKHWGLCSAAVESAITSKTRAILAVNLYGHPAALDELRKIADLNGLALIEDNAEAPFATWKGAATGSFGDISTFSFFGNKVVTSGEGGAVTTNDLQTYNKMKILRDHGMSKSEKYHFPVIGYNFRLNNLSAAVLVAQISRKNEILENREKVYNFYNSIFKKYDFMHLQMISENATLSPWLYPLTLESLNQRNTFMQLLNNYGVETRPFFKPVHLEPPYVKRHNNRVYGSLENTINVSNLGMNLPTASNFKDDELDYLKLAIINSLNEMESLV